MYMYFTLEHTILKLNFMSTLLYKDYKMTSPKFQIFYCKCKLLTFLEIC